MEKLKTVMVKGAGNLGVLAQSCFLSWGEWYNRLTNTAQKYFWFFTREAWNMGSQEIIDTLGVYHIWAFF